MSEALLISPGRLKSASEVHSNVDDKIITRAIITAQDIEIEMILGSKLMDKIKELITSGDISQGANQKYKTLLEDHIENALIYYTMEELMDLVTFKVMNKGVMAREADEARPIGSTEMLSLKRRYRSKAEIYGDRLMRYLIQNSNLFDEYNDPDSDISSEVPRGKGFNSGFYLD
jgi:hypothetical protein